MNESRPYRVEVLGVGGGSDDWDEGRVRLLVEDGVPVHLGEPRVILDLVGPLVPQPLVGLLLKQPLEEILEVLGQVVRELRRAELDLLEQFLPVGRVIGRDADHYFVENAA